MENTEELKYFCLKLELAEWLDKIKADNQVSHSQDLIRVGIILALRCDKDTIKKKELEEINRASGDRNFNAADIKDGQNFLPLLIKNFSPANPKNTRMQALANLGVAMIRDKFYDDGLIRWDKIEDAVKNAS